jgi:hypothetical protein
MADAVVTPVAKPDGSHIEVKIDSTPKPAVVEDKNRPEWLDAKFKTVEEQAKAYVEAQKLIGQKAVVNPLVTPDAPAGIDTAALSKEFADNGKLSDTTMASLAAKGITKTMVEGYITGLQAKATEQRTALAAIAGGEANMQKVYAWAATSMTPDEIKAYNAVVDAQDNGSAKLMLSGIVQRYNAAMGVDPKLVKGERVDSGSGDIVPFDNSAQVTAAMSDPKYATDEAYRQRVIARLAGTSLFPVRH